MKTGSFWSWSLGVGLLALPLIGGCLRTARPPAAVATPETTVIETDPGITLSNPPEATAAQALPLTNAEEAAVQPLPAGFTLPANVQPGKSLTDLIRLAQSGADEGVLLVFVTNSPNAFGPSADDLIYLKDIGVPPTVISALLQRDEQLKASAAAPAPAVAPPPAPAAGTEVAALSYAAAPAPLPGPAVAAESAPPPSEYGTESAPPPPTEVIYPDFYGSLAPYGSWMDVDGYGYCWQPAVVAMNPLWQPYFDGGQWAYTDCGWYWMSDYSWGWAPFHYGRWFHHNRWGWCWQPDRVWGPSWVCWRHNDTHCGWAPLPPGTHFTAGIGLTGSLRPVTELSPQHFRFVEWRYFGNHQLAQHALSREQGSRIYGQTTTSTRIVVLQGRVTNDGLSPERVAARTHTPVTRVSLHDVQPSATASAQPDRLDTTGRTLSVYRPQVKPVTVRAAVPAARVPMTKPLAVSTPSAASTPSPAPASTVVVPPPQNSFRQPATAWPPATPSHSYEATSRYYPTPGTAGNPWRENSRSRLQSARVAAPEVPQYSAPAVETAPRGPSATSESRFRMPANPSPGAARFNQPPAERPARPQPETPRFSPPPERPSRVEPAESRASHAAPAAPSPAPSRSASPDRSDKSDRSDSSSSGSSHGRR